MQHQEPYRPQDHRRAQLEIAEALRSQGWEGEPLWELVSLPEGVVAKAVSLKNSGLPPSFAVKYAKLELGYKEEQPVIDVQPKDPPEIIRQEDTKPTNLREEARPPRRKPRGAARSTRGATPPRTAPKMKETPEIRRERVREDPEAAILASFKRHNKQR